MKKFYFVNEENFSKNLKKKGGWLQVKFDWQCFHHILQNPDGTVCEAGEVCWEGFQSLLNKTIQDTVIFAKKIPGFPHLDQDDQISLIKGGCFEVGMTSLGSI